MTKKTTEGKPWAVYARLSKAASGDLEKVEHQVELCRQYADSRGLPVDDAHLYIDNSLSAWRSESGDRPGKTS